jgi:hypothetical protein
MPLSCEMPILYCVPRRPCDVVCLVRAQVSVMTGSGSSLQSDTQSLN